MTNLNNIIGQERAKNMLRLLGEGYRRRRELPSIGIFGNSGLGKTHLVDAFAEWLDAKQIYINGTAVTDALAFRAFFRQAAENTGTHHIVFIDECHRLPKKVQDNLLSVLEKPSILCTVAPKDLGVVKNSDGTTKYINKGDVLTEHLPRNVSFILATTDPVEMKPAVLTRLRKIRLEQYTEEEKAEIAIHHMSSLGVEAEAETYVRLANRSRNIRHLKDDICATFVDIDGLHNCYGDDDKLDMLDDMLGLDEDGATDMDRDYMEFLAANKIASVETLAKTLAVDVKEIKGSIEPFLFEKGWVTISGRGRKLTIAGHTKITGGSTSFDESFVE